jgi:hypothetical protein
MEQQWRRLSRVGSYMTTAAELQPLAVVLSYCAEWQQVQRWQQKFCGAGGSRWATAGSSNTRQQLLGAEPAMKQQCSVALNWLLCLSGSMLSLISCCCSCCVASVTVHL